MYGTYEHPVQGWVGNANSGHLGLLAGYVKGNLIIHCLYFVSHIKEKKKPV